jgi:hypothetical protein
MAMFQLTARDYFPVALVDGAIFVFKTTVSILRSVIFFLRRFNSLEGFDWLSFNFLFLLRSCLFFRWH